jgi:hypothetical protein
MMRGMTTSALATVSLQVTDSFEWFAAALGALLLLLAFAARPVPKPVPVRIRRDPRRRNTRR